MATSRCPARYYRSDYDWYLGAAVSRKSGIRLRPRRRLSTRGGRGVQAGGKRTQSGNLSQLRMPGEDSHMKSAVGDGEGDRGYQGAIKVRLCETAYLGGRA